MKSIRFSLFLYLFAILSLASLYSQEKRVYITRKELNQSQTIDDTNLFRKAIQSAYQASASNKGWREPIKIIIPAGHYRITGSIINKESIVNAGKFIFEGDGWQNTVIEFIPDKQEYLFDNHQLFGFTTFTGIDFRSNSKGKFMNGVGGGTGNAQSFIFDNCKFSNWNTIISSTGSTMMSEVTFRDCKINGSDKNSILFDLDNAQGVNWRFFATDIENVSGIIFNYKQGSSINIYQGSIIPTDNGIVFNIPPGVDQNKFGGGNNPQLNCNGTRFEMRNKSQLIKISTPKVHASFDFFSCGMGGYNITDQFVIETADTGRISFINCENFNKYKFKHNIVNEHSFTSPLRIIFINSSPSIESIMQGECTKVVNDAGSPIYSFINCGINSDIRPFALGTYYTPTYQSPIRVTKNVLSPSPNYNRTDIAITDGKWNEMWRIKIPDVNVLSLKLYITGGINYGSVSPVFEIKLTNKSGNEVFINDNYSQNEK
ncbi:MAG: hypothetical protein PHE29_08355, partial [Tissierellia bacterium]|nr:hypothetical protein [Tissierellia bacterium]